VDGASGEAKFWLEPSIEEAENHGLNRRELSLARRLIRERLDEIRAAWKEHFGR
jgi:alkanesulfonate monooxygenase SsuD/methylene tetrahydromethanopterin reductase-like flavin-dependent oxidoreductase (luciferase family)